MTEQATMTDTSDARLQRLLGTPALADVRQRLRRHFERIDPGAHTGSLRLAGLDPAAHSALCQLTGRPSRAARSMILDITDLDARLRASGLAASLRDALERLEGPIVARTHLRRALQARWSTLATTADGDARLRAWLRTPVALTLLKRLGREPDRAAHLLADATAVLRRLPAAGLTRSQLAAETLGDAHALDAGRPVATLVLAVWRLHEVDHATVDDHERVRDVWARAGVLVNELARPVLFLNLPWVAGITGGCVPGEPAWLSLRQLLRSPPAWRVDGCRIFVCENPNVVAIAADRLGAACAPLVCTDGMPAAAQRTLLDQLAAGGARLHYHGDYDWAGIGIGNLVMRRWNATPWRFGAADYLLAVGRCSAARRHDLDAATVDASWDPELGRAMRAHGLAIAEEAVVETLVDDLRAVAAGASAV
ncbi:MAG: TIGR02679 family protein [Proteobacteria bacterium]|nr:TIGR02679 family protein [Pseudomonadota bacterium]